MHSIAAPSGAKPATQTALRTVFALLLALLLIWGANSGHAAGEVTVTHIHTDISGNPIAATDENGNLIWKENYQAFGTRQQNSPASAQQTQWFHGKEQDATTGLQYFGARHYDPKIGRFLGIDPVGFQDGNLHSFNRYAYGNNNPIRYLDPDGNYVEAAAEALSLSIGLNSLGTNLAAGKYGAATIDGLGVVADAVLSVVPFAPGVAGLGIQTVRKIGDNAVAGEIAYYRGARAGSVPDFTPYKMEFRVDSKTGFVQSTHGVSIFD